MVDLPQPFEVASRIGPVRGLVAPQDGAEAVWVLHGRGASAEEVRPVAEALTAAMETGVLRPATVVVPDGPWSLGAHWWADSAFAGGGALEAGRGVESALLEDVRPAVDPGGRTGSRAHRTVVGVSMGGAAALRWLLRRPDLFDAAVLLSPACYEGDPPPGSSAVTGGAFGRGGDPFSSDVYRAQQSWAHLLDGHHPPHPAAVAITVGDAEPLQESASGGYADLTLEAGRLHARLRRHPGVRSSLRVVGGGHEVGVWAGSVVDAAQRAGLGAEVSAARGGTVG